MKLHWQIAALGILAFTLCFGAAAAAQERAHVVTNRELVSNGFLGDSQVRTISLGGPFLSDLSDGGPPGGLLITTENTDVRRGWNFTKHAHICNDCYSITNYLTKRTLTVKENGELSAQSISSGATSQEAFRIYSTDIVQGDGYVIQSYTNHHFLYVDIEGSPALGVEFFATKWKLEANFYPSHDLCPEALEIAPGDSIISTTVGATRNDNIFGLGFAYVEGPGVWFNFTGTGGIMHIYVACEEPWLAHIAVFLSTSCDVWGGEGGERPICNAPMFPIRTVFGQEYWIVVSGVYEEDSGDFEISMFENEDPDSRCGYLDNVVGAPCEEGSSCLDFITTCRGSGFNISPLYSHCGCVDGAVQCTASMCPALPTTGAPTDTPTVAPTMAPLPDECTLAQAVSVDSPVDGTTVGASISINIFGLGVDSSGPTVWYSFIGTGETLKLTLACNFIWNAGVRFIGGTCTQYNGAYFGSGWMCENGAAITDIKTVPGEQYYIMVEGREYSCIGQECPPPVPATGDFRLLLQSQD